MKEELCKAFCDDIRVRDVPFGLAVGTGFDTPSGDPIGFYVSKPDAQGLYRIQDDGATIFNLEAQGADIGIATRAEIFRSLLDEYGFEYDADEHLLQSPPIQHEEIAKKALNFVALLLRIQDIAFLVKERAASTFKDEVTRQLTERLKGRATIERNVPIAPKLVETPADLVMRAANRIPVALFLATSDNDLSEAIITKLLARHEANVDCSIIALIDTEKSVSKKKVQLAKNRLTAVPEYRGDEDAALDRIVEEVVGFQPMKAA